MTAEQVKRRMTDIMLIAADDGCPESYGYVLCDSSMQLWTVVRTMLVEQGWLTVANNHWMTLTTEGQAIVDECRQPE